MKGNFVRGAPWIMQWQSGFAGLAEINMIPNKETRWNWRFYPAEREGKKIWIWIYRVGFKAMMHKGHMCREANVEKRILHTLFIILYLSIPIHKTVFLTHNECIQQGYSWRCSGVMQENHPEVIWSPVYWGIVCPLLLSRSHARRDLHGERQTRHLQVNLSQPPATKATLHLL